MTNESFFVKEISLDTSLESYAVGNNRLAPLSKINIFVGENNSGKSRFLRLIACLKQPEFVPTFELNRLDAVREQLRADIHRIVQENRIGDVSKFYSEVQNLKEISAIKEDDEFLAPLKQLIHRMRDIDITRIAVIAAQNAYDGANLVTQIKSAALSAATRLATETKTGVIPEKLIFKRLYIPTLRGLRPLQNGDPYLARTKTDYFTGHENVDIFTGLTLYEAIAELSQGDEKQREIVDDFQTFLGRYFFNNQRVTLVPKYKSDTLDVKIGDEAQRPIFLLGDGIQAIIILTFPIFRSRDENLLVFIEEPELFLHPALQRTLLTIWMAFPKVQYFFATHSNHLLDLTLDLDKISIFTFRKHARVNLAASSQTQFVVENVSNDDERSLQLLGINSSSVFLSNCTVWVEGITDRRYLSHYLDLYQDSVQQGQGSLAGEQLKVRYKQDLHYSFVEYAGANITHFSFLTGEPDQMLVERLCAKAMLIADKDDPNNAGKAKRHSAIREKLRDRYVLLSCREIENLLTPTVIAGIVKSYEGKDAVLNSFDQEEYRDAPLGKFIEEHVLANARQRRASYQVDGGTISDKVTFCQKALERIQSFADLSADAKELTKSIYTFVVSKNGI